VHEVSIVQALIEQVDQEVAQAGHPGRVVSLDLVIGRLSGVHPDSIRFAFQLLTPHTLLEGATLRIEEPQASCCCRACGAQTPIDDLILQCPRCGSVEVSIEGGRDLVLQSIELEDEPSADPGA
jgi:hydrogenase nickel incorporation protein HypA/HybF